MSVSSIDTLFLQDFNRVMASQAQPANTVSDAFAQQLQKLLNADEGQLKPMLPVANAEAPVIGGSSTAANVGQSGTNGQSAVSVGVVQNASSADVAQFQTYWHAVQLKAYDESGHAETAKDAIAQNDVAAAEDAVKVPTNQMSLYAPIKDGQTELAGQDGKAYYITNVGGVYYKSQVPVAIDPSMAGK